MQSDSFSICSIPTFKGVSWASVPKSSFVLMNGVLKRLLARQNNPTQAALFIVMIGKLSGDGIKPMENIRPVDNRNNGKILTD
ncbi:hypothetical protein OAG56_02295 [Mariniblastus sp.]|nr:hypothetical protein [Mariniblastus sp.]MDB4670816.1 hypothetical protein [Pirellulaceae bacterium]MDB4756176.1 hypothetical protein [Mariniblastus sp.]